MESQVKSALIGALSAIAVALIAFTGNYFITTQIQTPQSPPIIIREPFVVKEKVTIREYIPMEQQTKSVTNNNASETTQETNNSSLTIIEEDLVPSDQKQPDIIMDYLVGKKIGIYYSLGNMQKKSIAGELTARMKDLGLNSSFYSVGTFYRKPKNPSTTYIYCFSDILESTEFIEAFRSKFKFPGSITLVDSVKSSPAIIEGSKWRISNDKDVYIFIGD